jgi:hypothetical protein
MRRGSADFIRARRPWKVFTQRPNIWLHLSQSVLDHSCICPKACWTIREPLTARAGPYMYLSPAANSVGPVWSRPRGINRTVLPSHLGFPRPRPGRLPCPEAHLAPSPSRSSCFHAAYTPAGWGHGGTRNSSTSRSVHTRSVRPAAIAGVHGRHCAAELVPWVSSGCGRGWRTLAWGKQKLS